MAEPYDVIPEDRLPEGFAESVEHPPDVPVTPRPAATIVLVRPSPNGEPEVLLLRRNRQSGFVPGAYVFPGGRVDSEDASPTLVGLLAALTRQEAAARLDLVDSEPPAIAYYLAALREAFEETAILVADHSPGSQDVKGQWPLEALARARTRLLEGEASFAEVLDNLGARLDGSLVEYIAHWVTPVAEPRRYDTRFFMAIVPSGAVAQLDPREMIHYVWRTPAAALRESREGKIPMIFPTLRTLQDLSEFSSVEDLMVAYRGRKIPRTLPRLVRTPKGVGLELGE